MSISAIQSSTSLTSLQRAMAAVQSRPAQASASSPEAKAASQFEAIIIRQLIGPAIEPVMSGGLGGASSAGSGVYGFMLTDVLAENLSAAGGLGLGRMLQSQLGGGATATAAATAGAENPLS